MLPERSAATTDDDEETPDDFRALLQMLDRIEPDENEDDEDEG
jgi:hypothetical protein